MVLSRSIRRVQAESVHRLTMLALAGAVLCCIANVAVAQLANEQSPNEQSGKASLKDEPLEKVLEQYNEAVNNFRSTIKEAQSASTQFFNDSMERSEDHRRDWQKTVEKGNSQVELLRVLAMELFYRQEKPSDEVIDLALRNSVAEVSEERYSVGLKILKRANELRPTPQSRGLMAHVQLLDNEFSAAKSYFNEHPDDLEKLSSHAQELYAGIDQLILQFEREKELRRNDAEKDDLPRVELQTTAGKIVLELFEDEAPQTVANFIYLVEKGYYHGVIFHNVKEQFVAQAGGFGVMQHEGTPRVLPRGVRYYIYDEHEAPNARRHFRGSLSMANQNSPNTASSQIFLALTPQPGLNENHTVFGRVIEGSSAMADLTLMFREGEKGKDEPIEDATPSMILSAKVIRKRNHDYEPVKVGTSKTDSKNEAETN